MTLPQSLSPGRAGLAWIIVALLPSTPLAHASNSCLWAEIAGEHSTGASLQQKLLVLGGYSRFEWSIAGAIPLQIESGSSPLNGDPWLALTRRLDERSQLELRLHAPLSSQSRETGRWIGVEGVWETTLGTSIPTLTIELAGHIRWDGYHEWIDRPFWRAYGAIGAAYALHGRVSLVLGYESAISRRYEILTADHALAVDSSAVRLGLRLQPNTHMLFVPYLALHPNAGYSLGLSWSATL